MKRLRGLKDLIHDAVDATADLVGEGHASAGRTARRVTDRLPPLAGPAAAVDAIRVVSTETVLGAVRGTNRAVQALTNAALDALGPATADAAPVPLRSDALGTPPWIADATLGMLNGVVGDHLDRTDNPLDLGLSLRVDPVEVTGRLVILAHGLSTTEWSWCLDAERRLGAPDATYGAWLHRDLELTPVWVRYNTGRRLADNATRLAAALDATVRAWPVPVEEVVLVGHSMGGLVARLAATEARDRGLAWVSRLTRLVCLGSPHHGAPLERLGVVATSTLGAVDLPATRILAALLAARSAGIRDLGRGVSGETPLPLLPEVRHAFAAGTITADPDHLVTTLLGDMLVRLPSATDPTCPAVTATFPGRLHHELQVDREVYDWLRSFCAGELDDAPAA